MTEPTPSPAALNSSMPVQTWRETLAEAAEAPAETRHEQISDLLDELDSRVGGL